MGRAATSCRARLPPFRTPRRRACLCTATLTYPGEQRPRARRHAWTPHRQLPARLVSRGPRPPYHLPTRLPAATARMGRSCLLLTPRRPRPYLSNPPMFKTSALMSRSKERPCGATSCTRPAASAPRFRAAASRGRPAPAQVHCRRRPSPSCSARPDRLLSHDRTMPCLNCRQPCSAAWGRPSAHGAAPAGTRPRRQLRRAPSHFASPPPRQPPALVAQVHI